jgi:hypothetical protein
VLQPALAFFSFCKVASSSGCSCTPSNTHRTSYLSELVRRSTRGARLGWPTDAISKHARSAVKKRCRVVGRAQSRCQHRAISVAHTRARA